MKVCPKCGTENEDGARTCVAPHCDQQFDVPELPARPEAPVPAIRINFPLAGPQRQQARPQPALEAPAIQGPQGDGALEKEEEEEEEEELSPLDQKLLRFERSGLLTIGVIGFATSGKTFFVNRLKEHVLRTGDYVPVPGHQADGSVVEGTREIEAHDFRASPVVHSRRRTKLWHRNSDPQDFHVIDIPGEQFRRAVDNGLLGEEARTLLRVLRLSHALIVVLPADEVFSRYASVEDGIVVMDLEERRDRLKGTNLSPLQKEEFDRLELEIAKLDHAQAHRRLRTFLTMISKLAGQASEIEDDEVKLQAVAEQLKKPDLELAGLKRGAAPPIYIAIAKADLITKKRLPGYPHIKDPLLIDADPPVAFRIHREELYDRIRECFTWYKFDFVTCFQGQPSYDVKIRYDRRHFGVGEVVDWIHWARDHSLEAGRRKPHRRYVLTRTEGKRLFHTVLVGVATALMGFSWLTALVVGLVYALLSWALKSRIGLVRRLGEWREDGVATDPRKVGLDPDKYGVTPDNADHKIQRWIAGKIERALGASRARRTFRSTLILGGVASVIGIVLVLSVLWLIGVFGKVEPSPQGYAFAPRPVYAAEVQRMENDDPNFSRGFTENSVAKWEALPSNGGWFNFWPNSPGLRPLQRALELLPVRAQPGTLAHDSAERIRSLLDEAAVSSSSEARGANNYHRGLTFLLEGQSPSAAQAFTQAAAEIESKLAAPSPNPDEASGQRYAATTYRLHAALISIQYALGVAELNREHWGEAANAFQRAEDIARRERSSSGNRIVDPATATSFWYVVATRDSSPMLHVPTAAIWTNLLAALIRQHAALGAGNSEEAELLRTRLAALVQQAAEHADEAARDPKLAVNLIIAAARSGVTAPVEGAEDGEQVNLLSRFHVNEAAPREVLATGEYAPMIVNAQGSGDPRAAYWRVIQEWRGILAGESGRGQQISAVIDQRLNDNPDDRADLRAWLCNVMEVQYRESSAPARREITRNYGQYYCDADQWRRFQDAAAPFGLLQGLMLAMILLYATLAIGVGWHSLRRDYRRLFTPQHHLDRLGIR